jgi:hypothetical protein
VIAIPQPSHAWLYGQMARAWGNAHFTAPAPHEEVCLAAKQHDIGWLSSEIAPAFECRNRPPARVFQGAAEAAHRALARLRGNKRTPSGVSSIGGVRPAGGIKEMDNNQNGGVDRLVWPFRPVAQLIAIDILQFGAQH